MACVLATCVSLYLTVSILKWLKRSASVPMPVLNAWFCESKRTELLLDYEKVKCNGQRSKINLFFSSLYYEVLNDNSNQNGKDSKKCKDDSSAHLVALWPLCPCGLHSVLVGARRWFSPLRDEQHWCAVGAYQVLVTYCLLALSNGTCAETVFTVQLEAGVSEWPVRTLINLAIKEKKKYTSNKNALHTPIYLSMVLFMVMVTVKRMTPHQCFHPCKEKWTKSSQIQFKCQRKTPVLLVKHRKSTFMAWWVHAKETVRSPSITVFLVTTYNVNTPPWHVIHNIVSQKFK